MQRGKIKERSTTYQTICKYPILISPSGLGDYLSPPWFEAHSNRNHDHAIYMLFYRNSKTTLLVPHVSEFLKDE